MRAGTTGRLALIGTLAVAGAVGCGSDDGHDESADASEDAGVTTSDGGGGVELPEGCALAPFEVEWRTEGDGALEPFEVVDAVAFRGFQGGAWTFILADTELDRAHNWALGMPDLPAHAVVLQTGVFVSASDSVDGVEIPPIEVGEEMTDGGTQYPVFGALQGVDTGGSSVDQVSTATLRYADDGVACMDIDVTSESGVAFSATVAAEIVRDE